MALRVLFLALALVCAAVGAHALRADHRCTQAQASARTVAPAALPAVADEIADRCGDPRAADRRRRVDRRARPAGAGDGAGAPHRRAASRRLPRLAGDLPHRRRPACAGPRPRAQSARGAAASPSAIGGLGPAPPGRARVAAATSTGRSRPYQLAAADQRGAGERGERPREVGMRPVDASRSPSARAGRAPCRARGRSRRTRGPARPAARLAQDPRARRPPRGRAEHGGQRACAMPIDARRGSGAPGTARGVIGSKKPVADADPMLTTTNATSATSHEQVGQRDPARLGAGRRAASTLSTASPMPSANWSR